MPKLLKHCIVVAAGLCLLLGQALPAVGDIKDHLVDVKWLEANLKNPDVMLLDASPGPMYAAQHIPGAISVDLMTWYGIRDLPITDMTALYQSWGISPAKTIVMCDQGGSFQAARLLYSLYHDGYPAKDLLILDGGLARWQAAGLPVTKDATPAPGKGSFTVAKVNADVGATLPEVVEASGDPQGNALVEALGADWHYGAVAPFDRPGHIPNSVLLPSADFFNADKTFKSPDEIRKMLAYVGVRPEQRITTYCGGGMAAATPWFALKFLAGYPQVRLYTESELGWIADERGLPYWTYDAPYLMRQAAWLQWWGGKMIRMYAGMRVNILDIRPADAFAQGHVPFALNVPAEVFRSNIATPDKLAQVLGQAGVDPSLETVVISGAGLTKDAALAFALLQRLGQQKSSILVDSLDEWGKQGFAVTKDPTAVGPRKAPRDLAIPPVAYTAKARPNVVIADPKSTQGAYPKVFVASGAAVPVKAFEGAVVHVPYTDLLSADGTPKAAKDIWSILSKAGVPRYAELICISDDPGEAAANYFVLKLMGWPDVKVLVWD